MAENCRQLSIGYVKSLAAWKGTEDSVSLIYSENETPHLVNLKLSWTACNYGGNRPWFHCPRCDRRVGKLYLTKLADPACDWACRKCHDLTYRSCNASGTPKKELELRANRIRRKLRAEPGYLYHPSPERPKHMRWDTYSQLHNELFATDFKWNRERCRQLASLGRQLGK